MNTRKESLCRAISSNIHSLGQCTLMAREQVMSDQQVSGNPCNLIPALRVCYYQPVTSCVQDESLNLWKLMHHSEMIEACSAWWVPDPRCSMACGQFKPSGMVAWASSVFWIPLSRWAQVHLCSIAVPVSVFQRPHLPEKASTQSRGTFLQHLPLNGFAAISTGQAGAAYGQSQFLVMCSHCDIKTKYFLIGQTA
jgi:hypothetical protein